MEQYLEIGQIVTTNGVRGFVKVKPFTDDIKRFSKLKKVFVVVKKELVEFEIDEVKYLNTMVLLKFKGIDSIEQAEKYRNCYLKIDRKDAVKLPKNSYFIVDLIGCEVYLSDDEKLGIVEDVFSTGSNDVYVVRNEIGKQILIPAIASVVQDVDVNNKKIVVKLIEGLIWKLIF